MFVARINSIPDIMIPQPDGSTQKLAIQCHQATCYWLYEEVFDRPPTGIEFTGQTLLSVQSFMGLMAQKGLKLSREDFTKRNVAGGTVLIFTDPAGEAKHSCVVRWDGSIGGYNQTDWFTTDGKRSEWSVHDPKDIPWSTDKQFKVFLQKGPGKGNIIGVKSQVAVAFFRDNYQN